MKKTNNMFLTFLACVVAVPTLVFILPGIEAQDMMQAVTAGVLLGIVYLMVRPILRLLTFPLGCLTFGVFHFALDVGILFACAHFIEGFTITSIWSGVLAAILVNAVIAIVGGFR